MSARLERLQTIESTFQRAVIFKEAIALPPSNPEAFTHLRNQIRAGIADAWGYAPEKREGFRAHTSVCYSNSKGSGLLIKTALLPPPQAAKSSVASIDLIRMQRDHGMYEWETVVSVPMASA